MKGIEIREFMGDYALDIPMGDRSVYTIYFNSHRNAETVKRIMEVDDSIPNAATVCDMVEVVRCKDCKYYKHFNGLGNWCHRRIRSDIEYHTKTTDFCSYGERKEQT